MKSSTIFLLLVFVSLAAAATQKERTNDTGKREKSAARQLDYLSLINKLLQQTNVLSSFDGLLLALTTIVASLVNKLKPMLITTGLWYLIYVAAVLLFPGPLSQMGFPTFETAARQFSARSVNGFGPLDDIMTSTFIEGMKVSPIMNVITNVTVTVITETMSRLRLISRNMIHQLTLLQSNMGWFGRVLSAECVTRFMCRVGQFTIANFPTAAVMLRSLADNYPGMDDYAVAVIRGTSSANCSLIYPDCTF